MIDVELSLHYALEEGMLVAFFPCLHGNTVYVPVHVNVLACVGGF